MNVSFADLPFALHVLPVTPFAQNCSLLIAPDGEAVVIDPGGDVPGILRLLTELRAKVRAIWLTHGHFDHVGGAAALKEALGSVPVLGPHREDAWLVEHVEEQAAFFGLADAGRSVTPDRWLEEGDVLKLGAATFTVHHCPGHTPGHVLFLDADHRIAFVGDVLFAGSIGRTDFKRLHPSDQETLLANIRDRLLVLPDDVRFIPGHGPASTIGHERRTNPFLADIV